LRERTLTFAKPEILEPIGPTGMAGKPKSDRFETGRGLGCTLRARPTVRTDIDGARDRTRERDAFLAAITGTEAGHGRSRGEVYQQWLAKRLRAGGGDP